MIWSQIFHACSRYLYIFSLFLLLPLAVAFSYEFIADPSLHPQPFETVAFLKTLLLSIALAVCCQFLGRKANGTLYRKEGMVCVVLIWVMTPALSAFPFLFNKTLEHFEDAYFEMCSGLTTTGASILTPKRYDEQGIEIPYEQEYATLGDEKVTYRFLGTVTPVGEWQGIEAVGKGLLFWRSLSQWCGGVGVVLLFIMVLPTLGASAKVLYQSEVAGPVKESWVPRIQDVALWILKIYLMISAALFILLLLTDPSLPFFDALTLTFSTVSSGGFAIRNDSMASYHSAWTQWLVTIFMVLGTINFSLYYYLVRGKFYRLRSAELVLYMIFLVLLPLLACVQMRSGSISLAIFQTVSCLTTTGFTIANYDHWPFAVQVILLFSTFIGGMSASTSGGLKVLRGYLLSYLSLQRIRALFAPGRVFALHAAGNKVDEETSSGIFAFFFLYITIAVLGTLFYIFDGVDVETAIGAVACNLNNAGCAFRAGGPEGSFAFLSSAGKWLSCFLMLLGRLEVFIILMLFVPKFWRST